MPGNATVIGRVAIKVVPQTDDFRKDAKRQLDAIEKTLRPVEIDFKANTSKLDREVREAVRDAQRNAGSIAVKMEVDNLHKRKVQAQLVALGRRREVTFAPKVDQLAAAKVVSALAALSGGAALAELGRDFGQWVAGLGIAVPRLGTAALAVTNLSGAALAGVSNLLAFGSSLASTAGAALALPGILGGVAIGVGATVAVLKDFNKVLPEVGQRLAALQDRMSSRFWAVAEQPIRGLVNELLPQLSNGLERTSASLGKFFSRLADSAAGGFDGQLAGMFDDLNRSIDVASRYTDSFVGILEKLGSVGAGNLPRLAGWFGDISRTFDNWLARKGRNGLQEYVDTGVAALQDLGSVVASTGSLFAGLARAAEAAGGGTLGSLRKTMKAAAETVNGARFQSALTGAFEGAHAGMDQLTKRSGPAFERFMLRLSSTLTRTLPIAGRAAGDALGGIFDALDQPKIENTVVELFRDLDTAVGNLVPALPGAARALAAIIGVAGDVTVNLSRGLAPALESLSPAVERLAGDLGPLVDQLGNLLANVAKGSGPVVADLAAAFGGLAKSLAAVLAPINDLFGAFERLPGPVKTVLSSLTSAGLLVAGGAWFGSAVAAKLAVFSTAILNAGTRAGVAQGAFLRAGIAAETMGKRMASARGMAAFGAGLTAVSLGATSSNKALGALANIGGGALMGFAAGGPIGAAIGGAAGGLLTLAQNVGGAKDAMVQGKAPATDYAASLDRITGAATTATRELAYLDLQQRGAIKSGAALGLSARDMVDAALGQEGALKRVNAAVLEAIRLTPDSLNSQGEFVRVNQDLYDAQMNVSKSLGIVTDELGKQSSAVREQALATADLKEVFKGLPKRAITQMEVKGVPQTERQVARLTNRYNLTPKQVRTVLQATGIDASMGDIRKIIRELTKAGKIKARPELEVNTKKAEDGTGKVVKNVRDIDKLKGVAGVEVDDKATKPLGEVRRKLESYAKLTVKATVAVNDQATAKLNAIRSNLAGLNGRSATVTTYHRAVYTSSGNRGGGGGGGGGATDRLVTPRAIAGRAGADAADAFSKNFSKVVEKYRNKVRSLFDAVLDKAKTKDQRQRLHAMFDGGIDRLQKLTQQHERWMRQLDKAKDKYREIKQEMLAFKDAVISTVQESANPVNMEIGSYDDLIAQMTDAKLRAQEFYRVIKELIKNGLNKTTLKQILAAGPEAGMATAQAIIAGGVSQINAIQAQIDSAANGVASAAGDRLFGGLLDNAQADVDKLIEKLAPLQARLRKFARDLVAALRDQLDKEFKKAKTDNSDRLPVAPGGRPVTASGKARTAASATGTYVAKQNVLHYHAAPGPQVSSEEQLFGAMARGRAVFAR